MIAFKYVDIEELYNSTLEVHKIRRYYYRECGAVYLTHVPSDFRYSRTGCFLVDFLNVFQGYDTNILATLSALPLTKADDLDFVAQPRHSSNC